uniref:Uncharacterized protein n=1 Tax=Amphora coffeiformis TaxID=265554 RepID=A0A7S3L6A9_9STRA
MAGASCHHHHYFSVARQSLSAISISTQAYTLLHIALCQAVYSSKVPRLPAPPVMKGVAPPHKTDQKLPMLASCLVSDEYDSEDTHSVETSSTEDLSQEATAEHHFYHHRDEEVSTLAKDPRAASSAWRWTVLTLLFTIVGLYLLLVYICVYEQTEVCQETFFPAPRDDSSSAHIVADEPSTIRAVAHATIHYELAGISPLSVYP